MVDEISDLQRDHKWFWMRSRMYRREKSNASPLSVMLGESRHYCGFFNLRLCDVIYHWCISSHNLQTSKQFLSLFLADRWQNWNFRFSLNGFGRSVKLKFLFIFKNLLFKQCREKFAERREMQLCSYAAFLPHLIKIQTNQHYTKM